jgi:hypothetical protein
VIPGANEPGVHNGLYGVTAVGPNDVWAVGYRGFVTFRTLITHWNGSTWQVVPNPDPENSSNILIRQGSPTLSGGGWCGTSSPTSRAPPVMDSSVASGRRRGARPGALCGVAAVRRATAGRWATAAADRDRPLERRRLERVPEPHIAGRSRGAHQRLPTSGPSASAIAGHRDLT